MNLSSTSKKIPFYLLSFAACHLVKKKPILPLTASWHVKDSNPKIKRESRAVCESAMCQSVTGQDSLVLLG